MKKTIFVLTALLYGTFMIAQTEFDAQKLVQPDITGTARYMGMAGAFCALGGDASAIKDNPGGLGIYRSSEITGTIDFLYQNSNSQWNGTTANDNLLNLGFTNFAYILAKPTFRSESSNSGLQSSNWSFSYNRLKSFDRNSTINSVNSTSSITDYMSYFTGNIKSADLSNSNPGTYDPYGNGNIPWISLVGYNGWLINETVTSGTSSWSSLLSAGELVSPSYSIQERGFIDEYSIGWAGNFSNKLFIGATMNLQDVNYNMNSQYKEVFGNGGGMTLSNSLTTGGIGFNVNAGFIYRPIDILRLGLSVHTPTVYALTDNNSANLDYYLSSTNNGNFDTPGYTNNYLLATPWKINAGAALILGQKGLISAEYDLSYNKNAYFMDKDYSTQKFREENSGIPTMIQNVQTLKIGAEYKYTSNIAFRVGYANMSAGTNPLADLLLQPNTTRTDVQYFINNKTNFITCGFGYRESNWFLDIAYVNKIENETFYAYNTNALTKLNPSLAAVIPANVNTISNNLVFTLGLKF